MLHEFYGTLSISQIDQISGRGISGKNNFEFSHYFQSQFYVKWAEAKKGSCKSRARMFNQRARRHVDMLVLHFSWEEEGRFSRTPPLYYMLLVVFSACGGIRTSSKLPVLTAYFLAFYLLGHLGKGWIVRGTTIRILLCWDIELFYPVWNRLYKAAWLTAKNWPDARVHKLVLLAIVDLQQRQFYKNGLRFAY